MDEGRRMKDEGKSSHSNTSHSWLSRYQAELGNTDPLDLPRDF